MEQLTAMFKIGLGFLALKSVIVPGNHMCQDVTVETAGTDCTPQLEITEYPWCGTWGRVPCLALADYGHGCEEFCVGYNFGTSLVKYYVTRGQDKSVNDRAILSDTVATVGTTACADAEFDEGDEETSICASWYMCAHPTDATTIYETTTFTAAPQWNELACYGGMTFDDYLSSEYNGGSECTAEAPCPVSLHKRAREGIECGACLGIVATPHDGDGTPTSWDRKIQYARVVTFHETIDATPADHDVAILSKDVHFNYCETEDGGPLTGHGIAGHFWHIYTESGDCTVAHEFAGCTSTPSTTPCSSEVTYTENTDCTEETPCPISAKDSSRCADIVTVEGSRYVVAYSHVEPSPDFMIPQEAWPSSNVACNDNVLLPLPLHPRDY